MSLIAVDWGTTRLRAFRLEGARVIDRASSGEGVATLAPDAYAPALARLTARWRAEAPDAKLLLVGMVGSRNGWAEAPYVDAPCGAAEIAHATLPVTGAGLTAEIVPGVVWREPGGVVEIMRGEETLALGADLADGLVVLPGTHSKWVEMREGRIVRFATFSTGEMFALVKDHAFIARHAEDGEDESAFREGLRMASRPGGAARGLFQTRARFVAGALAATSARSFLSGLLIGQEFEAAAALFPLDGPIRLVADGVLAQAYRAAFAAAGVPVATIAPENALVAGLAALARARQT